MTNDDDMNSMTNLQKIMLVRRILWEWVEFVEGGVVYIEPYWGRSFDVCKWYIENPYIVTKMRKLL